MSLPNETAIEGRRTERPIPQEPRMTEREFAERLQNRISQAFMQLFGQLMNGPPMGTATMATPGGGWAGNFPRAPPSEEDVNFVNGIVKDMEPEIHSQTAAMIRGELRDMMLLGGNLPRIKELLRSGRMPKFVRKRARGGRDPLWLQFGDGVKDEIEEFLVLG